MRILIIIFFLTSVVIKAQTDKVFFRSGNVKKGLVVSIVNDFVFYKASDTSLTARIPKKELIMVEKYDGKVIIFSDKRNSPSDSSATKIFRNTIGIQPFNVLLGRITASYERLNKEGNIGFLIPVSLTFDPVGVIYKVSDSLGPVRNHLKGINVVTGADVNIYCTKKSLKGLYYGPRVRYGVDMLAGIEAYSLQTQFGYKAGDPDQRIMQQLSIGFGFVRILASPAGNLISPKQSYGWLSINYRIGFNW